MRSIQRDGVPNSVLGRAITLLSAFSALDSPLSLAELSQRSGIPKATVHRLVVELTSWGLLEQSAAGVQLGMRLFELGQLAPRRRTLREAAFPAMNDLHDATQETTHLAVLDGTEVVYVEKLTGRGGPSVPSRVGGRMPAHCTGVGKAILAFSPPPTVDAVIAAGLRRVTPYTTVMPGRLHRELADIRRSGLAHEREESTLGVVCVACPILGPNGMAVGAVSITGWSNRLDTNRVAVGVRATSLAISRSLGWTPPVRKTAQ
jgi:IclR family acetate operon transcriptional repressor